VKKRGGEQKEARRPRRTQKILPRSRQRDRSHSGGLGNAGEHPLKTRYPGTTPKGGTGCNERATKGRPLQTPTGLKKGKSGALRGREKLRKPPGKNRINSCPPPSTINWQNTRSSAPTTKPPRKGPVTRAPYDPRGNQKLQNQTKTIRPARKPEPSSAPPNKKVQAPDAGPEENPQPPVGESTATDKNTLGF